MAATWHGLSYLLVSTKREYMNLTCLRIQGGQHRSRRCTTSAEPGKGGSRVPCPNESAPVSNGNSSRSLVHTRSGPPNLTSHSISAAAITSPVQRQTHTIAPSAQAALPEAKALQWDSNALLLGSDQTLEARSGRRLRFAELMDSDPRRGVSRPLESYSRSQAMSLSSGSLVLWQVRVLRTWSSSSGW